MQLHLEPGGSVPLYAQIAAQIRRLVSCGAVRPGERLPTVRELAVAARVNRNTAARAIQILEAEGLVSTQVGRGTFVSEQAPRVTAAQVLRTVEASVGRVVAEARELGVGLEELKRVFLRAVAEAQPEIKPTPSRSKRRRGSVAR